jgi:hypothetical protein
MASPPTSADASEESAIHLLDTDGEPIDAIPEWMPALIDLTIPVEAWPTAELRIQGISVETLVRRLHGASRILANWPRSGPGHYRLQFTAGSMTQTRQITIRPRKISEAAYERMLEDLETRLPATVAIALQRAGALAGITLPPPGETTLAQELQRLRTAIRGTPSRPGLARVLVDVAHDPHRVLQTEELWVRQDRARRPHPARLAQSLVRANNLDGERRPLRVIDARVEEDVDVYENRLLAFFHQVQLRLRRLVRASAAIRAHESFADGHVLLDELLLARRRAGFLDDVSLPPHLTTRLTMVLMKRPAYRAALEGFLAFHRSVGVRLEHPGLEAPLENLPSLYQTWGTLEVLVALIELAGELGYRVVSHHLVGRDATGLYVRILPDGRPAVVLHHPEHDVTVEAIPERTYRRKGSLHSISYPQVPDLALEVRRPGESVAVWLFDPKYKLDGEGEEGEIGGRPTKVDIDKMHAYRDAIRDDTGARVVCYAAILYPGPPVKFGSEIAALPANPSSEGVLVDHLWAVLRTALRAHRTGA